MALMDEIERLGRAVENGSAERALAVQELVKLSQGDLTERGAADLIDRWKTVRAQYTTAMTTARAGQVDALNEVWRRS
ncbi:hypothetical protein AB0F36_14115 [Streptomyces sp. NPDC029080]|uniref:hypothetical protein n=1 Tax=Streptomyces sp. NPDC029080 TaxID=3155017 RepID=UPI0033D3A849